MHKIKKGIKKKIKGKKDKDAELFTPEEYERYKKQKGEQGLKQEQNQPEEGTEEEVVQDYHQEPVVEEQEYLEQQPEENNIENGKKEDWRNFFSATDTVLKKTTVNLEHIKESSYFQAKKHEKSEVKTAAVSPLPPPVPAPPTKRWVDLDKGGIDDALEEGPEEEEVNNLEKSEEKSKKTEPLKDIVLKPIEDIPIVAEEDYADVFDTTYVDAVEEGEVQLFEIPDSPTLEDLNEPDPFDTSNAEKVLHIEQEEPKREVASAPEQPKKKKKKNLVNLGCAVEVLTGKVAETSAPKKKSKEVDLLLADFGDDTESQVEKVEEETGKEKKKNTEDSEDKTTEDKEAEVEGKEEKCTLEELLFGGDSDDGLPDVIVPPCVPVDTESKEEEKKENFDLKEEKTQDHIEEELAELLDPLAATYVNTDIKDSHLKDLVAEFDVIDKEKNAPAVPVIPELLKTTSLGIDDNIHDEFDAEFAVLAAESIAKEKEKAIDEIGVVDEDDPFDTSVVNKVFGEADTLNNENIDKVKAEEKEVDPFNVDFAEEFVVKESKSNKPARPAPPKVSPLSAFAEEDPFDTSAAAKVLPSDPFEAVEDSLSLPETLKPQFGSDISQPAGVDPQNSEAFDPFDTSVADSFGKTELRVLEGELLSDISQKVEESDLDFDFNPREEEEKLSKNVPPLLPPSPACLLTAVEDTSAEVVVLTPQTAITESEEFDPFDTSIAEKIHIKSLEAELLSDLQSQPTLEASDKPSKPPPPRPVSPSCLLASLQESDAATKLSSIAKKALAEDFDPFDTSIADHLEGVDSKVDSEESTSKNLKLDLKPPRPASPVCLLATTPTDANPTLAPVLQPCIKPEEPKQGEEEFDPFDTSIAEQFGKTELKVLETELLTTIPKKTVEEEDQFDPRAEEPKPSRPPPPPRPVSPGCLLTSKADEVEQNLPPLSPVTANELHQVTKEEEEIDPFDTSIADKFGKTEILHLESQLLSDISEIKSLNLPIQSTNPPQRPPPPPSQCLFATTPTDSNPSLQPFSQVIEPKEAITAEEIDPFDTSIADQFGKTELKALEETLLSESHEVKSTRESVIQNLNVVQNDHLFDISPSADCLPVLEPSTNIAAVSTKSDLTSENFDPFDTSIAAKFGQVELKVLESELLVDSGVKRNLSDDEFDPREEEKSIKRVPPKNVTSSVNILDYEVEFSENIAPVLQANLVPDSLTDAEPDIDPFDTSIAENLVPGKQELKFLDQELLSSN